MEKETEAKIRSLEEELVKLKQLQPIMFQAFQIGINRMEQNIKEALEELRTQNINKANSEVENGDM